jgi:hypothetical protein
MIHTILGEPVQAPAGAPAEIIARSLPADILDPQERDADPRECNRAP